MARLNQSMRCQVLTPFGHLVEVDRYQIQKLEDAAVMFPAFFGQIYPQFYPSIFNRTVTL